MSDRLRFPDEPIPMPPEAPLVDIHAELGVEFEDDGPERNCMTCTGEGWEFCGETNSAEGCWEADCDGVAHTCPNCRGSGLAKDQCFW